MTQQESTQFREKSPQDEEQEALWRELYEEQQRRRQCEECGE